MPNIQKPNVPISRGRRPKLRGRRKAPLTRTLHRISAAQKGERTGAYIPQFIRVAESMCVLGATNADLAIAFDVSIQMIAKWRMDHKDFSDACKRGEARADADVERSLYERARGYEYEADKLFQYEGRIIRAKYSVHVPCDTNAAIFWLTNRLPHEWSRDPPSVPEPKQDDAFQQAMKAAEGTRLPIRY